MTKTKSTKKALIFSVLSLVLCLTMLVGTTFAWFTDSVTSGKNIIVAGNLDLVVEYSHDGENWMEMDAASDLFPEDALWEPGFTSAVALRITNAGTLAFKYDVSTVVYSETESTNVLGEQFKLSDFLKLQAVGPQGSGIVADILQSMVLGNRNNAMGNGVAMELYDFGDSIAFDDNVTPGEQHVVLLSIHMPTPVGNDANYDKTYAAPSIEFGVNVVATQATYESDDYGPDYDKAADYVAYYTEGEHEVNATLTATTATDVITASGADTVVNVTGGYYDVGSQDCAVWAKEGATVNIYDGTFIADGLGYTATSADHQDMIYAGTDGNINIYGGFFTARGEGTLLLNEKDNSGVIVVYGGTFVNWNPADNVSEGANTSFLA